MMATQLAAQLYTLREFTKTEADIAETMKKVKQLGYDAVQCSALGPIEPEALKKIIDNEGITICATHTSYARMRDEPQAVIDEHNLWGCKHAAIGGLPGEYRSTEGYAKFAQEASEVAARLAEGGLTFSYHNHSFELERYNGRTGLQILYEESDPKYFNSEIDTYWIQHGGGDPAEWIRKLKGRAHIVHLKDMAVVGNSQRYAEVGEGNLNWPAILNACEYAEVEWYIVEQDSCYERDPFESLGISLKNLQAMGLS
ncbi:MAG: sugar phosphate isomerase/epimerase [Candidatus Poribacteria bacterium]|nr:sugar phosphate isomerase/epimerase [Candidatus Poribacteria bacterium]